MKRIAALLAVAVVLLTACDGLLIGQGEIRLGFVDGDYASTKAAYSLPDTSDFVLSVTDASGKTVYKGAYGASPESILVNAGTYTIKVISNDFKAPAFDTPQYGDEQVVKIAAGAVVHVKLVCTLLNCGIRLKTDSSFLTSYPKGLLYVKSTDGKLLYAYKETRIAYFNPGSVSVVMNNDGVEETLMSRTLQNQQILTVSVSASASSSTASDKSGISLQVDTSKTWLSEKYKIGSDSSKGTGTDNAYSVVSAKENIGEKEVWVCGYIVGGDLTTASEGISFDPPFSSRTNLALGPRSSTSSKSSCLSVFLPTGDVREDLNLVDNPDNVGRQVYIKGDIVSAYYGIPGIKNVTEYRFK